MLAESGIYAIQACEFLARETDVDVYPTRKISRELGLSNEYLVKVLQKLKFAGIVRSKIGAAGGVQLQKETDQITLYEIIQAVNPSFIEELKPDELMKIRRNHSELYAVCNRHIHDIQKYLKTTTLKKFSDYRSGLKL